MSNAQILDWTYALVPTGIPYVYGAGGLPTPLDTLKQIGTDCSAIVEQILHAALGIDPGRTTVAQLASPLGEVVPTLAQALPGDEIYFGSPSGGPAAHVGIFLGGNQIADNPHSGSTFGIHTFSASGYGSEPILGIRRFGGAGPLAGTQPTAGAGATVVPASFSSGRSATATSTAGISSSILKIAVEATLTAAAAGLLALAVLRGSQQRNSQ